MNLEKYDNQNDYDCIVILRDDLEMFAHRNILSNQSIIYTPNKSGLCNLSMFDSNAVRIVIGLYYGFDLQTICNKIAPNNKNINKIYSTVIYLTCNTIKDIYRLAQCANSNFIIESLEINHVEVTSSENLASLLVYSAQHNRKPRFLQYCISIAFGGKALLQFHHITNDQMAKIIQSFDIESYHGSMCIIVLLYNCTHSRNEWFDIKPFIQLWCSNIRLISSILNFVVNLLLRVTIKNGEFFIFSIHNVLNDMYSAILQSENNSICICRILDVINNIQLRATTMIIENDRYQPVFGDIVYKERISVVDCWL